MKFIAHLLFLRGHRLTHGGPVPADCCGCNCTACHSGNCCNDVDGDNDPLGYIGELVAS